MIDGSAFINRAYAKNLIDKLATRTSRLHIGEFMPLIIIRQDITKIHCDAIVNPTNRNLKPLGGTDAAINKSAGPQLAKFCSTLGVVEVGEVKVSPAFNLPCKYIIHTVGPVWKGGNNNEETLLKNCYTNSMKTAVEHGCETIAIPLISSGTYGYPKDQVLRIAIDTICSFLFQNELTVYLVLFSKSAYAYSSKLFKNIKAYIDDNYVDEHLIGRCDRNVEEISNDTPKFVAPTKNKTSLNDMLSKIDDSFAVTLMHLIDEKGMTDVECYKKANQLKQTWYKILNCKDYKPSKNTVLCFAIALELNLFETQHLLSTAGYALSNSNKFDVIIQYFISHKQYNIFDINQTLFEFNQEVLGSKSLDDK